LRAPATNFTSDSKHLSQELATNFEFALVFANRL
jgi:hypothetical protein